MYDYQIGDVVELRSSGPSMTIMGAVDAISGTVRVGWFADSDQYCEAHFHTDCLIPWQSDCDCAEEGLHFAG